MKQNEEFQLDKFFELLEIIVKNKKLKLIRFLKQLWNKFLLVLQGNKKRKLEWLLDFHEFFRECPTIHDVPMEELNRSLKACVLSSRTLRSKSPKEAERYSTIVKKTENICLKIIEEEEKRENLASKHFQEMLEAQDLRTADFYEKELRGMNDDFFVGLFIILLLFVISR